MRVENLTKSSIRSRCRAWPRRAFYLTVLILSLDTSTRAGSAAVLRGDEVLSLIDGDAGRTHGERLPSELAAALDAAGIRVADVDLLAVARGPGAFTGLRIGLAAMQGLAMVAGLPVVGVSALDALAADAFARVGADRVRVGAWMDAARGEVFAAAFDAAGPPGGVPALTTLCDAEVGQPGAVWQRWQTLSPPPPLVIGDGAMRYREVLADADVQAPGALAPAIARLAARQWPNAAHTPHALEPLYVRRPDAERGRDQ